MEWAKRLSCLLLAFLVTVPLPAQRRSRRSLPHHYRFIQEKEDFAETARAVLRNGLTVLVEERASIPVTAVISLVALDSAPGSAVRSHALRLARLAAEASGIEARTATIGGLYRLREDLSGAAFVTLVPADNLAGALEIHRDLLTQGGNSVLVTSSLSKPEAEAPPPQLYRRLFRTGNVVLSVSGTALRENLLEKVVELYAPLKNSGPRLRYKAAAPSIGQAFSYSQRRTRTHQPGVVLGFRVPDLPHADFYPLEVLRTVLAEGRNSLSERMLVAQDLAIDVASRWRRAPEGSLLEFTLTADRGKLDAAEVGFLSQLETLRTQLLDHHELNRAKALLLSEYFQQRERLEDRAVIRARREVLGGSARIDQPPAALLAVTPASVQRALRSYLTIPNLSLTEQLPNDFEQRDFTSESLLKTLQLLLPTQTEKLATRLATLRASRDAKPLKLPGFTPRVTSARLKRTSVLRGPEIYLLERHRLPLVHVGLLLPGGRIEEETSQRGVTELALRSLAASAAVTQPEGFWREVESYGCRSEIINHEDFFGYRFSCLSIHTDDLLGRLIPWLHGVRLDAAAVKREQRRLLAQLDSQSTDSLRNAEYQVRHQIFGDHPYGSPAEGDRETVSALTPEATAEWAVQQIGGFHPTLLILGDVAGTAFLSPLVGLLSNSKLHAKKAPEKSVAELRPVAEAEVEEGRLLAVPGPVMGTRDAWLVGVLEKLLGQWGGEIPASERAPAMPGIHLYHRVFTNGGVVMIHQERASDPLSLRRALADLPGAPIKPQDHLNSLVVAITDFYAVRQYSPDRLVDLARNLLAGEKPDFEDEFLATLKGVQLHEVRGLAQRLFEEIPIKETAGQDEVSP